MQALQGLHLVIGMIPPFTRFRIDDNEKLTLDQPESWQQFVEESSGTQVRLFCPGCFATVPINFDDVIGYLCPCEWTDGYMIIHSKPS